MSDLIAASLHGLPLLISLGARVDKKLALIPILAARFLLRFRNAASRALKIEDRRKSRSLVEG
jgi:hypothetical protein